MVTDFVADSDGRDNSHGEVATTDALIREQADDSVQYWRKVCGRLASHDFQLSLQLLVLSISINDVLPASLRF